MLGQPPKVLSDVIDFYPDGWGCWPSYVVRYPGGSESGYITREDAYALARRHWPALADDIADEQLPHAKEG